ncbi:MAG: glycosyltransferase family 4 protein, partial [Patescibacteria group bacterium]
MRILVVADVYPPEVSSAANLMQELAEGLAHKGHAVTVVTAYPKHYLTEASKDVVFEERSDENGIEVIRVRILPHHKVNFIVRGISQLTMPFLFFRKTKKYVKGKIDAAIIYSPPLPLGLIAGMLKRRYGARTLLNLQDIFPQNAIDLGILKFKPAIWFFERIEKCVYKKVDVITFHSEGGRKFLIETKHVPAYKIVAVPNWVDIEAYQVGAGEKSFRKEWNLENKFIFLFAGIFGPAQGLEFVLRVAEELKDIKDAAFLLVGDGMEKEKIVARTKELNLTNVVIKPFISQKEYASLVAESDVGLVCLSTKNKTSFVPGKLLGYMAAHKPALAFLNKESDGFHAIKDAECGYATTADNLGEATSLARKMYSERGVLPAMGERGFIYAKKNLSRDVIVEKLEKLL